LQCDVVEPWEHGSVLRTPSAPNFWDANFVRVEGDASDLEPLALVKVADALLAGSRHRKLEVQDERAGARMRPFFESILPTDSMLTRPLRARTMSGSSWLELRR